MVFGRTLGLFASNPMLSESNGGRRDPHASNVSQRRLSAAAESVVERLEHRVLLSGNFTTVQSLPYTLDFSAARGGIVDRVGLGTGFTFVQGNRIGNEYQPSLLSLDAAHGLLNLTTSPSTGTNFGADNTLVNGLGTQFNAATSPFTVTTRLRGPLTQIAAPYEQAGVMFGPDQDNYIKLVAIAGTNGPSLQLADEEAVNGAIVHQIPGNQFVSIGSFGAINTLDLRLSGDPATGRISGSYSVNGGAFASLPGSVSLSGAAATAFFASTGRAGILAAQKNTAAPITVGFDSFAIEAAPRSVARPSVLRITPGNSQTGVSRNAYIALDLNLPNLGAGVDARSLSAATARLYRTADNAPVDAYASTSGGGDDIVIQPHGLLDANTQYTVMITDGVRDTSGAAFIPFTATFTTGAQPQSFNFNIAFQKTALPTAQGQAFTSVTTGPDGKLYAATYNGQIFRWAINSDGTLGGAEAINTVQSANGGLRTITGLCFDPSSTASNLILWVTHNQEATNNADDWTGKISRLSGASLGTYKDFVVHLPRSIKDHMTNQLSFGPDGALYVAQSSNTSYGAPDSIWGNRPEHLLNGAILRINTRAITNAVDVKTDSGGTYNPAAPGAPVTLYATGLRNAYDMVWASNGRLYAPVNGSSSGGNVPAGPNSPAINNASFAENDYFYQVISGGYYGHPNPIRGQYVLNGGNPTSGVDPSEVSQYPVGTQPGANWQKPLYDFGKHVSPDGIIEYVGNAFNGVLNHKFLVCRYSGGGDIAILGVDSSGTMVNFAQGGYAGLSDFTNPVDLTEDQRTGFLYVAEYGGQRITLLTPITGGNSHITVSRTTMAFNDSPGGPVGPSGTLTVTNNGSTPLALPGDGLTMLGPNASNFIIRSRPTLPMTLAPGQSVNVTLAYNAPTGTAVGALQNATLQIRSNDQTSPILNVSLRGLTTAGQYANLEPGFQKILDAYQIPVKTGEVSPNDTAFNPSSPNDEVVAQRFFKAGSGPVTVTPLASFGVGTPTVSEFGYYSPGNPDGRSSMFSIGSADAQTLNPTPVGSTSFDPGSGAFGLFAGFPHFTDTAVGTPRERIAYSEDTLNSWDAHNRKMRAYPLKNSDGSVVPNAYVVAFEDYNLGYDSNDLVAILRNVRIAPPGPAAGIMNIDGWPYADRLIFNRINTPDPTMPNGVHDQGAVRLYNTGSATLNVTLGLSGPWQISSGGTSFSIAPGASHDVVLRFIATTNSVHSGNQTNGPDASKGGVWNGTLTVNSNDAFNPQRTIGLYGWWQAQSEHYEEPNLATLTNLLFNDRTNIPQNLNTGGKPIALGDEVLSAYWTAADPQQQVAVKLLASFHSAASSGAILNWFPRGSPGQLHSLFRHTPNEYQTLLPHGTGPGGTSANQFWAPSGAFGWYLDGEYSDDTRNAVRPGGVFTHSVRFFPVKDRNGKVVPNTWLACLDYSDSARNFQYENFDYQDLVYLITNVKPA